MGRIPQDVIDQVLAAHDIVEVVGRYVALRSSGRTHKALCPFHDEKTPSFTVDPTRQSFKCFGCGKGGNVFGFLMEHEGMTFPEAVRQLARERGIRVPEQGARSSEQEGRYEAVRRALELAHALYQKTLASEAGREARAYLARRGYDEAACARFGLGYAPAGWDRLLEAARARSLPAPTLEEAGLVLRRTDGSGFYDRFRHRVVFPIADPQGRVVTFGARALAPDDQPKYLNGPETLVFKKAHTLYGLDRAREAIRRTGEALLMEGYTDVLMCHLHGFEGAVAGMGTAFTLQQAQLLARYHARRVILVYDGDDAGQKAAERTLDVLLPTGVEVRVALLPQGRDVDEILLEEGRETVEAVLDASLDVLDFKLHVLGQRNDLSTPEGRARAGEELVQTLVRLPSPVARDQWMREAAERLGGLGAETALREEAARHHPLGRPSRGGRTASAGPAAALEERPARRVLARSQEDAERFLLAGVLFVPTQRERVFRAVGPEYFASPVHRRIYNAMLDLADQAGPWDVRTLSARWAEDAEVQAVLAGLAEDPTLEERIPLHLDYLERSRRNHRRAQDILRGLGHVGDDAEAGEAPERGTDPSQRDGPESEPREHVG